MAEKKTTATAPAKRASPVRASAEKPAAAKVKTTPKATTMLSAPVGETLRDQAGSFKDKAGDKAREYANTGKDKATDLLDSLSQTVADLAKSVDERLGTSYGDYARKAADAVSGAAGTLKGKDVDDLVADTREFVRKQPAIAIGAAAAVGFLLTRLVKAGSNDRDDA